MRRTPLLLLLALALVAAAAVPGDGSSRAAANTVTIRDASLTPATKRVAVGAAVEFVNKGRKRHKVVAERNLWAPFVLRPGARASIRLYAPGRYPYKVDGRRKGEVIAGTPIAGYPPRPGSTTTTVKHRYSVRIDAVVNETIAVGSRVDVRNLSWRSTIPSLVLTVQATGNSTILRHNPAARGTFIGHLDFRSNLTNGAQCAGEVDYRLASDVLLQGGKEPARSWVAFDAGLTVAAADDYDEQRRDAAERACGSSLDDADWLDETMPVDRGVQIHHPPSFSISAWDTRWSVERRGTPFPLNKMLAGQSFTVDTGARGFEPRSCGIGCVESFEGRAKYVFTALPSPRR